MATSAVLEAEGRTLVLSARQAESASYTQEMGHTAVGGHGNKKHLVPLLQGILLFWKWPYSKITKWQLARPKIHIQSVAMACLLHFLIEGYSAPIKPPGQRF